MALVHHSPRGHFERSAAVGAGGAVRSREIPWSDVGLSLQTNDDRRHVARTFHGVSRLHSARFAASIALEMTVRSKF
jgi:hypothetical protein